MNARGSLDRLPLRIGLFGIGLDWYCPQLAGLKGVGKAVCLAYCCWNVSPGYDRSSASVGIGPGSFTTGSTNDDEDQ